MNQDPHDSSEGPPQGAPDCLLTVAFPLALEEDLLDALRGQPALVPGFSVVHGQGLGQDAPLSTMMERVQGRARRGFVSMVMRRVDVPRLMGLLRQDFPSSEVFYWVVPLLDFGRLA